MSVVFTTTAAISGLAAAVLSTKLLHDKRNKARAQALNNLIDKDFKPTHKHLDAKGRYLLAFDMTSASVFVAEIGKDAIEPQRLPIDQLENVHIAEIGDKRITELRLDISLADDRRTLLHVHFLNSTANPSSPELEQARSLASLWHTRLTAHKANAKSLRAAMAADTPQLESTALRWYPVGAAGLASVSVLAIAASLFMPSQAPNTTPGTASNTMSNTTDVKASLAAASPAAAQPATVSPEFDPLPSNPASGSTNHSSTTSESELATFIGAFEQRIDDISERSLVQTRRTSTDDVRAVLDRLDDIKKDLRLADVLVDGKHDQRLLDETRFHLASTLQDVLPRYRRLYGTALPQDTDLHLKTLTAGYASRDLVLTNSSFEDDITRDVFVQTIAADLNRLRFDTVSLRAAGNSDYLETRDLGSPDDASLVVNRQIAAAQPVADPITLDGTIEVQPNIR